jgi:hypothetical protein
MDRLINFMNNKRYLPFPLSHFPLITNPSHIPKHFFTPCSDIDYSQENFCVKWMKATVSWVDYNKVLLVALQLIFVVIEK